MKRLNELVTAEQRTAYVKGMEDAYDAIMMGVAADPTSTGIWAAFVVKSLINTANQKKFTDNAS